MLLPNNGFWKHQKGHKRRGFQRIQYSSRISSFSTSENIILELCETFWNDRISRNSRIWISLVELSAASGIKVDKVDRVYHSSCLSYSLSRTSCQANEFNLLNSILRNPRSEVSSVYRRLSTFLFMARFLTVKTSKSTIWSFRVLAEFFCGQGCSLGRLRIRRSRGLWWGWARNVSAWRPQVERARGSKDATRWGIKATTRFCLEWP